MTGQLQLFAETIPGRPYATDDFKYGVWPMNRMRALERRYVQHNGPRFMRWAAFDIDRPGGAYDWQLREAPAPNITVENPENGHAHLLYGLAWPVLKTAGASFKALRYAGAVEAGLRNRLGADPSYANFTVKNPMHPAWKTETWQENLYDLPWLADYVDLTLYADRRRHLPPIGLGRNTTLFENLRHWAYSGIRQAGWPGFETWRGIVLEKALEYNTFPAPLPYRELLSCTRSIARWTWERFSAARFSEIQRRRAYRLWGDQVTRRRQILMDFINEHPKASYTEIRQRTGIPEGTAHRLLHAPEGEEYREVPDMALER